MFPSRAAAPGGGLDAQTLFTYTGGNYGDPAGGAAIFSANGSVAWLNNVTSGVISAFGLPTSQGWEWVIQLLSG